MGRQPHASPGSASKSWAGACGIRDAKDLAIAFLAPDALPRPSAESLVAEVRGPSELIVLDLVVPCLRAASEQPAPRDLAQRAARLCLEPMCMACTVLKPCQLPPPPPQPIYHCSLYIHTHTHTHTHTHAQVQMVWPPAVAAGCRQPTELALHTSLSVRTSGAAWLRQRLGGGGGAAQEPAGNDHHQVGCWLPKSS